MKYIRFAILVLVLLSLGSIVCFAGDAPVAQAPGAAQGPPLDPTLMAWKEQGAWYFLCYAPVYPYRIPPHYLTYGPPPAPYCPPPCVPAMPQRPVKK
jgi:hypothetical protein